MRLSWRKIGWGLFCVLPVAASAQTPFNVDSTSPDTNVQVELGGTPAVDLITLRAMSLGVPLRNGGVKGASERIMLNGQILQRGTDYSIDYGQGIIYVKRVQKAGDVLRVEYRYDPSKATTGTGSGFSTFKLDLVPGQFGFVFGLGLAERNADGSVVSSNIYGVNNSMSFGGNSLKGVMLLSSRQQVDSTSLLGHTPGTQSNFQGGQSKFILQSFTSKFSGGTIQANYQDVGKGYTGFGSVKAAGYTDAQVGQYQKEAGLRRLGLGFNDVKLGSTKFSNGFNSVKDGSSAITWRNFGFQSGGLSLNWNSRKIDKDFTRFKDLGEADRDQMAKEAGISRQNLAAAFTSGANKFSFTDGKIEDDHGNGIYERKFGLQAKAFTFNMSDRHVESGFNRMGSLTGPEQATYQLEAGLRRQNMSFGMTPWGKDKTALNYAASSIRTDTGDFKATDFNFGNQKLGVQYINREVDRGFARLNAMTPQEMDPHIAAIASMYQPGMAFGGEERGNLLRSPGVGRELWRFKAQPSKDMALTFDALNLSDATGTAHVNTIGITTKQVQLSLKQEDLGKDFAALPNLMGFEQRSLGLIQGLKKTDLNLAATFGKKKLVASQMTADGPAGDVHRQSLQFNDKNLEMTYNARSVDKGFTNPNMLIDPEKDLLQTMVGTDEKDGHVKWTPFSNFNLEASMLDSSGIGIDQNRRMRNVQVGWNPNKLTGLNYLHYEDHSDTSIAMMLATSLDRLTFNHSFGRYGNFKLFQEKQVFDGDTSAAKDLDRTYFSYDVKLNKTTAVATEQTQTKFADGTQESVSANTLSTNLTDKVGVSVTDQRTSRAGEGNDDATRNYGAWIQLPGGIKITYGSARQLIGDTNGGKQTQITATPGTIGGIKLDNATYNEQFWDPNNRTQANSNVSLSSAKPIKLGMLQLDEMKFSFNALADLKTYQQENRLFRVAGKLGTNTFAYQYFGQMTPLGSRAIDRTFQFSTDNKASRFITGSVNYTVRTLPTDDQVMIRDISFTARPMKSFEIQNHLITNPTLPQANVMLGSVPQGTRSSEWKLNYKKSLDTTFGATWTELINDQTRQMSRVGGVELTLFQKSGSPLKLFYGVEEVGGNVARRTMQRYSLQFDQKAGPNQSLSFFFGNVSYQHSVADGFERNNWTGRLDYNIRF